MLAFHHWMHNPAISWDKHQPVMKKDTQNPLNNTTFTAFLSFCLSIWNKKKNCTSLASEWLLFNAISTIFHLYHGEKKLIFNEMTMRSALYQTNTLSWIFIVLDHWNNSPWVDMSPHWETLPWFRANQSLLFLLHTACLEEKQQIPIL